MMEQYGVVVFGFILGMAVVFWSWMASESSLKTENGGTFSGGGMFRYAVATIGLLASIGALLCVKFVYYP